MLGWYKDANLTLPVSTITPKWVSIPLKGGTKNTSLWLGDAYTSTVSQPVGTGDTTIFLTQIDELETTGTVQIDQEQITYAGVSTSPPRITGCTRGANATTAAAHVIGSIVHPLITYSSSGNISVQVSGMTAGPTSLSLAEPASPFGPPGVPLLLPISSISSGVAGAVQIDLLLSLPAGLQVEYINLGVTTTPVTRPGDTGNGFATITLQPVGPIYVQQRDQGLPQRLRLLPLNRKVSPNLPGFEWGQYRWRDNTTENAQAVVPTRWDIDTSLIAQDFIGGVGSIGETNDLQPIDLEEQQSSIFLRAQRGQYFTGTKRYYLPSDNFNLEFLPCYPGLPFTYTLQKPPREQTPVFVGNWGLDSQKFYEYKLNARYTFGPNFDPSNVQPQFMVDRETGLLTVNAAVQLPQTTYVIGVLSGGVTEYFDLPVYPVDKIVHLYVGNPIIPIPTFTFDRENGNVTFAKTPGTNQGQPVFAVCDAAIAVLYEYDVPDLTEIQDTNIPDEQVLLKDTRLLTPDLNPAFSGLSSGTVYLQHRVLKPTAITLAADKPQIAIPPTLASIIGLIAYGPVFYNGDFALLTATAIGSLPNEVVPGAQLQVIPGGLNPATGQPLQSYPFRGLINGLDPNTNTIIVTTGGDGIANLVFQPEPNFGFYIPTSAPWVTPSFTVGVTSTTWSAGFATLTLSTPMSHEFVQGTNVRLAGYTPGAWDGDYAINLNSTTAPFGLTGLASISSGTATVQATQQSGRIINSGDSITIANATSSILDGNHTVGTASLSLGVWTITYSDGGSLSSTSQTSGTLTDNSQLILDVPVNPGAVSVEGTIGPLDTLLLPSPLPVSQVWSGPPTPEGWLEFVYAVLDNDPLFGVSGGNPAQGQLPFVTNGTVNGNTTITHSAWTGGIATFTLASAPTNLTQGENVDIVGCTTGTLNGIQNVLSVFQTGPTWFITTPTSTAGTGSESESVASFTYSNFRSNGVLSPWNKTIIGWFPNLNYQVGDSIVDTNNNMQVVVAISGSGTSGSSAPSWATLFNAKTTDNPGGNQIIWANRGIQGPSTSIPIHAFDKNGVDYWSGIYSLTGNAQIVSGTPNVATVQVADIFNGSISPGDTIVVSGAISPTLDGTYSVVTASLGGGVWTVTYDTSAAPFSSTPQTAGILTDTLFTGNVVKLEFNTGLLNPSQGFVQAYFFQFLEREIIQLEVVGTNILSNSIMLQMEAPAQIVANPYMVLSTDATTTPPFYQFALENSRFNINRLGQNPPVRSGP